MLDQLLRYEPVVALCVATSASRRLLEVGSGAHGIARYLGPTWSLTACDLAFDDYGQEHAEVLDSRVERVTGSVLDLPFADGSFPIVIALDLLEHIAPQERATALRELRRVTSVRLIVGCPAGPAAFAADRRLACYYRRRLRRSPPQWLLEHLENGFPDPDDLHSAALPSDTLSIIGNVAARRNGAIARWEATPVAATAAQWLFGLLLPGVHADSRNSLSVNLTRILRGRDHPPTYRTLVVVDAR